MSRSANATTPGDSQGWRGRTTRARMRATAFLALAALAAALLTAGPGTAAATSGPQAAGAKAKAKGFTVKAKSGTMTLTFSSTAWGRINASTGTAVGTATTPLAPATATPTGSFTFPVTHGSLNSLSGRGTVNATGGLMIERHISLGFFTSSSSGSFNSPAASLGASSKATVTSPNFTPPSNVPLLTLNANHVKVHGSRHSVSMFNIPAILTSTGVSFFGSSFKSGEQIGTLSIQIKG